MKGGIGQLMKQAQQMQADMKKAQDEMAAMQITGESGGGMVKLPMNGKHPVLGLHIDDTLLADD
jgi:DNA-binding YbaB/EbfC family protein